MMQFRIIVGNLQLMMISFLAIYILGKDNVWLLITILMDK